MAVCSRFVCRTSVAGPVFRGRYRSYNYRYHKLRSETIDLFFAVCRRVSLTVAGFLTQYRPICIECSFFVASIFSRSPLHKHYSFARDANNLDDPLNCFTIFAVCCYGCYGCCDVYMGQISSSGGHCLSLFSLSVSLRL